VARRQPTLLIVCSSTLSAAAGDQEVLFQKAGSYNFGRDNPQNRAGISNVFGASKILFDIRLFV